MHLTAPQFQTVEAARVYLESIRWPDGRVCPHCGTMDHSYETSRPGKYRCAAKECRKDFSVTVGTIYERSHIPLNKWLLASYLLCSSKKGISAHQLHRMLGVTYKTAWFMAHRIRTGMIDGSGPIGGGNKVVEADETYVGGKAKNRKNHVPAKAAVLSLVEREGRVRSQHVTTVNGKTLKAILYNEIERASYLMTDDAKVYSDKMMDGFAGHGRVNHSAEEFVRAGFWHTNTIENYFSIFKRGVVGVYHHVSPQHLKRYLAEFDFRYNERGITDGERMVLALRGIEGKRLMYRGIGAG